MDQRALELQRPTAHETRRDGLYDARQQTPAKNEQTQSHSESQTPRGRQTESRHRGQSGYRSETESADERQTESGHEDRDESERLGHGAARLHRVARATTAPGKERGPAARAAEVIGGWPARGGRRGAQVRGDRRGRAAAARRQRAPQAGGRRLGLGDDRAPGADAARRPAQDRAERRQDVRRLGEKELRADPRLILARPRPTGQSSNSRGGGPR